MNKTTLATSKEKKIKVTIEAEMKLALRKKTFAMKKSYFQSIKSMHA